MHPSVFGKILNTKTPFTDFPFNKLSCWFYEFCSKSLGTDTQKLLNAPSGPVTPTYTEGCRPPGTDREWNMLRKRRVHSFRSEWAWPLLRRSTRRWNVGVYVCVGNSATGPPDAPSSTGRGSRTSPPSRTEGSHGEWTESRHTGSGRVWGSTRSGVLLEVTRMWTKGTFVNYVSFAVNTKPKLLN